MYRTDFCEINLLRELIASDMKWPNVIINATTRQEYRMDIKGTLSLFSSIKGEGYYCAGNNTVKVNEDTFYISNEEQCYGIDINESRNVETFNIHFSTHMLRSLLPTVLLKDEVLLDNPLKDAKETNFYNRLYWKDEFFRKTVAALQNYQARGELNDMLTEELLADLLTHLYSQQLGWRKGVSDLSVAKRSTKEEVLLRLTLATDYIHTYYAIPISLDKLAKVSCLSKYHFLRLFKEVYRTTPYQYIKSIRLDKAQQLLKGTNLPVAHISSSIGYEDISSFSRGFKEHYGYWPSSYRKLVQK
ncbi:MAG: AraC family transcriptional regulator [Flavipsychrobacter sp.]